MEKAKQQSNLSAFLKVRQQNGIVPSIKMVPDRCVFCIFGLLKKVSRLALGNNLQDLASFSHANDPQGSRFQLGQSAEQSVIFYPVKPLVDMKIFTTHHRDLS